MKIQLQYMTGDLIRAWIDEEDGTPDSGADIDLVAFLRDLGGGHAEVCAAKGDLTRAMIYAIGKKALQHGYTMLDFHRTSTATKLRWAKLLRTEDGFDYYQVNLAQALG